MTDASLLFAFWDNRWKIAPGNFDVDSLATLDDSFKLFTVIELHFLRVEHAHITIFREVKAERA